MLRSRSKGIGEPILVSAPTMAFHKQWGVFAILHAPLALLLSQQPAIATLHAVLVLGMGFWFLIHDRHLLRVLYVCGYIVGAEVLWRMVGAGVFWEYGKYAVAFLCLLSLLRWRQPFWFPSILYFLLLVPAMAVPFVELNWELARRAVSFNLSASLALSFCLALTRVIRLNVDQMRGLLQAILLPVIGIATLALRSLITHQDIRFTTDSNLLASGGYGPNQVSAVLSLGALICWLLFLLAERLRWRHIVYLCVMLWLLVHALLTFSRGGVVNFAAAFIASLLPRQATRAGRIVVGVIISLLAIFLVLPYLNEFTKGMLSVRFRDLSPTGRDAYVRADLELWRENPISGVGVGMAPFHRARFLGSEAGTHTEFSRLLAEHGLLGLAALLLLVLICWKAYRRTQTPAGKTLLLAFLAWDIAEMAHSATRIVAIPFCFGLILLASQLQHGIPLNNKD